MDNPPLEPLPYLLLAGSTLLLLLTMLLVAAETALSSCVLSEETFEKLKDLKAKTQNNVLWLLNHPLTTRRALLFFRVVTLLLTAIGYVFALHLFGVRDSILSIASIAVIILVSVLIVLAQKVALRCRLGLVKTTASFTKAVVKTGRALLHIRQEESAADNGETFSVEGLEQALEMQHTDEERDILNGVLHFGEETVAEVMIPRVDVVDINYHADFDEVMHSVIDSGYSRLPVRDIEQDKIKGILYVKDLLPHCHEARDFEWQSLLRQPLFVPESKMIDDLLREFQKSKIHIAVVVDEYGLTSGIVTMEDILEEIVGEINDEYDEEEKRFVRLDENVYIFEGKTPLADFFETLGLEEDAFADEVGEAETVAGFVLELMDEFPAKHQKATCRDLTFEVLALDKRRISKIKVTVAKAEVEDAAAQ